MIILESWHVPNADRPISFLVDTVILDLAINPGAKFTQTTTFWNLFYRYAHSYR